LGEETVDRRAWCLMNFENRRLKISTVNLPAYNISSLSDLNSVATVRRNITVCVLGIFWKAFYNSTPRKKQSESARGITLCAHFLVCFVSMIFEFSLAVLALGRSIHWYWIPSAGFGLFQIY